ncbi:hypothetical protein [Nocardia pseudovaccinii]|uniref:hypothetical protein n=1 Tax=Nocardia pseudovaccinii TaxID=189540 RepID=UPI0012F479AB|nr:hypothetical protein [Nocardia pseudovaccinii]
MAVTTYIIGIPYGPSGWEIPDQVRSQLRLAHDLREDLVTLQLDYEQAVKDLWSSFTDVVSVEKVLVAAETRATELAAQVAAERSRQGITRITGPLASELTSARAEVARLRAERRSAIAEIKADADPRLAELTEALEASRKVLYAKYCRSGDLYWGTFNAVKNHHAATVRRISAARKQGRSAQLRHHRYNGTGTLAVELPRESKDPARTPALVAEPGGKYRNVIQIPWTEPERWEQLSRAGRRHAGRDTVRMRCGSAGGVAQWVDIPVQMPNRMLPADADITGVQLTVTRTADTYRARLAVTARIPDPKPVAPTDGPTVAVHMGWRKTSRGITVATWRSTSRIHVPPAWQHVMRVDRGGVTGTIEFSNSAIRRRRTTDRLASIRDNALTGIQDKLMTWLGHHGPKPHPLREGDQIDAATVANWRSSARLAAVALRWRDESPADGAGLAAHLETWRRVDRRRWERQAHGLRKAVRRRDDMWCNIAAILAGQAGRIVLDDTSIADTARRRPQLPTHVEHAIGRQLAIAAPRTLRDTIQAACVRRGVTVTVVPATGLSRTHARCGHQNPADERYKAPPVRCEGCKRQYDPDSSATVIMLRRARGR